MHGITIWTDNRSHRYARNNNSDRQDKDIDMNGIAIRTDTTKSGISMEQQFGETRKIQG
jgi:hypothetical protein